MTGLTTAYSRGWATKYTWAFPVNSSSSLQIDMTSPNMKAARAWRAYGRPSLIQSFWRVHQTWQFKSLYWDFNGKLSYSPHKLGFFHVHFPPVYSNSEHVWSMLKIASDRCSVWPSDDWFMVSSSWAASEVHSLFHVGVLSWSYP